jgi:hypothetical protein
MSVHMAMGKMSSCVEIKTPCGQDYKGVSVPLAHITIHPSLVPFVRVLRETRADS